MSRDLEMREMGNVRITSRGDWSLTLGNCLDPVTGLGSLDDKSVDHVITDAPYDEHTHKSGRRGKVADFNEGLGGRAEFNRKRDLGFDALTKEQIAALGMQFARVVRRWVLAFCTVEMIGDSAADGGSGWRAALERGRLDYVRTAMWRKSGAAPQFTGDRPAQAVEAIVIAHPKGRKRWNGGGKHGFYDHAIVLDRGGHANRVHTTQKPLDLMLALVEDFTSPGDLILDPFAGSGTTGVACRQLGRRFIGWELSAEYHAIASRRIAGERATPTPGQADLAFGT